MVKITAQLLYQIIEEVGRHMPLETGGVIMGELISKNEWIITHITGPGAKAKHNPYSYTPDQEHDEREIAQIYAQTNCNSVYLGDWHSHPDSSSYMSEKDKRVLITIAKSKQARMPHPIMLIIGTSPVELGCWTYVKSKLFAKEFVSLPLILIAK